MRSSTKQFPKSHQTIRSKLLVEYLEFTKTYQGVSSSTATIRFNDLSLFLKHFQKFSSPSTIKSISPDKIYDYIIKIAKTKTRSARKSLTSSLRSFLRFLFIKGYIKRNLVDIVPVISTRRLEGLPRGISWKDAKKLLKIPDRSTSVGRRNYAILQLILTYGVRINQALHIGIDDIEWKKGLIHFPQCKWNKALCFPLKAVVARAILAYVRRDRGDAQFPEIFLSTIGERKPLSFNYCLGTTLRAYYEKAGIQSEARGAHAIRHAFATRLMEKGTSIKAIADLLGHKSIRSTFIYTKVDIPHLRLLTCDWPNMEEIS